MIKNISEILIQLENYKQDVEDDVKKYGPPPFWLRNWPRYTGYLLLFTIGYKFISGKDVIISPKKKKKKKKKIISYF